MAGFVDPQFVDLLLSRLNELEEHHKEVLLAGSVENIESYKLFRGQLEGIQIAKREIRQLAERVFVDQD
jgi:hypothetical protein|tara:strand:+ start:1819 stop:2025 length:207 start_codon:yes stop_codon:yes gene_type:complete